MKNFLLALRALFIILAVMFSLGTIVGIYQYIITSGEGNITFSVIVEMVLLLGLFIGMAALFANIYDRRGYNDDRVVRREDLIN